MKKRARSRRQPRATTADVVGAATADRRVPARWRMYYDRLVDLRNSVMERKLALSRDALEEQPSFSQHMADAATDTFDRDLALGMLSHEQDAICAIDEALERIRTGTYGICDLTAKPIERKRLEWIPWTRFCAAAEAALEKEGALKRARLGPRETLPRERAEAPEE